MPLVVQVDGKGVVMRPEALRDATRRAAAKAAGGNAALDITRQPAKKPPAQSSIAVNWTQLAFCENHLRMVPFVRAAADRPDAFGAARQRAVRAALFVPALHPRSCSSSTL